MSDEKKNTQLTGAFYLGGKRLDTSDPETLGYVRSRFAAKPAEPVNAVAGDRLAAAARAMHAVCDGEDRWLRMSDEVRNHWIDSVRPVAAALAHPRTTGDDSATLTQLIAMFRQREQVGLAKYGTTVDRTDLTPAQWRQHLREELMDALLYSLAEEGEQTRGRKSETSIDTERAVALDAARRVYSGFSDQDAYVQGWLERARADNGMVGNGEVRS